MDKKKVYFFLLLIILLGSFLRFYDISGESFWIDEGATVLALKKHGGLGVLNNIYEQGAIIPEYYPEYNSDLPAYYLILSLWSGLFGVSELAVRSFSAILGSLALIVVFYLTRYLFDNKIALLSTFLSSINLTLIWYSQEARQYSYLLFLSLLSVMLLLKSLNEGKVKYVAGLLIVNALIIYSHFPWIIFIVFEGVYSLYRIYSLYANKKKLHKRIIVAFVIMGVLYLPIMGRATSNELDVADLYGRPDVSKLAEFGVQLATWLYPSLEMRQKIYDNTFDFSLVEWGTLTSVVLLALLLGLMFLYGVRKSLKNPKSSIFLIMFFFVPIGLALFLSLVHPTITIFQLKQMIYVIPAYLIFVSIGILETKISKYLIVCILLLSVLPLSAYYLNPDKQQIREAVEVLPIDKKIFLNMPTSEAVFKYYYGEKDNVIRLENIEQFESELYDEESFWVLLTFTKYSDPENKIKEFLMEHYEFVGKTSFFDVELFEYRTV
ncbi:MAG: glycosyltransferase family 39 protein [Bacteriovoracaceae bacterium]|nr:glycosyltransferase family 39 protein [Bacteriovoracaceae bacterium]